MSTQPRSGAQHVITLGGVPLEEVESFKYWGSTFTATGRAKDEISGRIGLARSTFTRLKATRWSRREISLKTKGRTYEALVRTILLYGCETWPVRVEDLRRLEVLDNDCLRRILRCSRRARCSTLHQRCSLRALPSILLHALGMLQDGARVN